MNEDNLEKTLDEEIAAIFKATAAEDTDDTVDEIEELEVEDEDEDIKEETVFSEGDEESVTEETTESEMVSANERDESIVKAKAETKAKWEKVVSGKDAKLAQLEETIKSFCPEGRDPNAFLKIAMIQMQENKAKEKGYESHDVMVEEESKPKLEEKKAISPTKTVASFMKEKALPASSFVGFQKYLKENDFEADPELLDFYYSSFAEEKGIKTGPKKKTQSKKTRIGGRTAAAKVAPDKKSQQDAFLAKFKF